MIKARVVFYGLILIGIAVTTTFIYHNTQQADINYYRGHRLFEKGEYDKAVRYYKNAVSINPEHLEALRELGYSYQWTKKHADAIDAFLKALALKPADKKLKKALAKTYSWRGDLDNAIKLYSEILEGEDDIDVMRDMAGAYLWAGKYDKAKNILEDILKKHPDDSTAKLLLARTLHYGGEAEKAIPIYKELLGERN